VKRDVECGATSIPSRLERKMKKDVIDEEDGKQDEE